MTQREKVKQVIRNNYSSEKDSHIENVDEEMLVDMSQGNPGAATVLGKILKYLGKQDGLDLISKMNDLEIKGSSIWSKYKKNAVCSVGALYNPTEEKEKENIENLFKHINEIHD